MFLDLSPLALALIGGAIVGLFVLGGIVLGSAFRTGKRKESP